MFHKYTILPKIFEIEQCLKTSELIQKQANVLFHKHTNHLQ